MLEEGARVIIHNQTIKPMPSSEGIDISTNYQTNVGVSRSFLYKLSSPYSDCVKNTQSINGSNSFYYQAMFSILHVPTYRQRECLDLCQQDYIKQACACLDASLPIIYPTERVCSSLDDVWCVLSARTNYSIFDSSATPCDGCPLECDSIAYALQLSRSRYPTSYYTQYLQLHTDINSRFPTGTVVTTNYIQKNICLLNVFYTDLAITNVEEVPAMTFDVYMGNVGAYMGLFVGMSLLSVIEIAEIGANLMLIWLRLKREAKKRGIKKIGNSSDFATSKI